MRVTPFTAARQPSVSQTESGAPRGSRTLEASLEDWGLTVKRPAHKVVDHDGNAPSTAHCKCDVLLLAPVARKVEGDSGNAPDCDGLQPPALLLSQSPVKWWDRRESRSVRRCKRPLLIWLQLQSHGALYGVFRGADCMKVGG